MSLFCHFNITLSRGFVSIIFFNLKVSQRSKNVFDVTPSPIYVQFDSVNQFRSGKDEVEDDAGQGGVPHNLGSFPIRITVIATHNEKLYKILKPDKISIVLLCNM